MPQDLRYKLGGPPHPVIVTIRDKKEYVRILLYSYYTTITGWGGSTEGIKFEVLGSGFRIWGLGV